MRADKWFSVGLASFISKESSIMNHPAGLDTAAVDRTGPSSHYSRLIEQARKEHSRICVVAHPCDDVSLGAALQARAQGLFEIVLVGPQARLHSVAAEHGLSLEGVTLIDTPHSHASAERAVEEVLAGRAQLLMKGSLHTDELIQAVLCTQGKGLRTGRRLSHVFIMDVPSYSEPLFVTDGAINIFPDLSTKADIVQNAIDLHHGLGLGEPLVAILSAVEQGIVSPVAGKAQILVAPDLEAGNMLAKNLTFLSGAQAAGIVMGARVPIILTSRADSAQTRMASCAVASIYAGYLERSSSLKFHMYKVQPGDQLDFEFGGQVSGIGSSQPAFKVKDAQGQSMVKQDLDGEQAKDLHTAQALVARWLLEHVDGRPIAVGHRIVHGGARYDSSVPLTPQVLEYLDSLSPLAPLHQQNNLAPVRVIFEHYPEIFQVACLDTAFHQGHAPHLQHFALPGRFFEQGVRRYGFHGLSYHYISQHLRREMPELADGRVVVAHLGSGASACALKEGRSVHTTMGFTALDGLPMGTRPGRLDAGVVLWMLEQGMEHDEIQSVLYTQSGIARHLEWMGVEIDPARNQAGETVISTDSSPVRVLVIPTNEELIIAEQSLALVRAKQQARD
uniref:Probable acetate kinase n=1 Tax=Steinernema glaseri TaxID=37863 RepID=A0A1I8AVV5_9BILA